jgi:hypothetical protein
MVERRRCTESETVSEPGREKGEKKREKGEKNRETRK